MTSHTAQTGADLAPLCEFDDTAERMSKILTFLDDDDEESSTFTVNDLLFGTGALAATEERNASGDHTSTSDLLSHVGCELATITDRRDDGKNSSCGPSTSSLFYSQDTGLPSHPANNDDRPLPDLSSVRANLSVLLPPQPFVPGEMGIEGANVYGALAAAPIFARALDFRRFLHQKHVPSNIDHEESAGVFVGQLPSSYMEEDIKALLRAIGNESGQAVQVRDVKCHNRERTCAFVVVNAGAVNSLLAYSKRALCDINCIWIVAPSQAPLLPSFVQQLPREQLRGVPKGALVLEKLTPQVKSHHAHQGKTRCVSGGMSGHNFGYSQFATPMPLPQNAATLAVAIARGLPFTLPYTNSAALVRSAEMMDYNVQGGLTGTTQLPPPPPLFANQVLSAQSLPASAYAAYLSSGILPPPPMPSVMSTVAPPQGTTPASSNGSASSGSIANLYTPSGLTASQSGGSVALPFANPAALPWPLCAMYQSAATAQPSVGPRMPPPFPFTTAFSSLSGETGGVETRAECHHTPDMIGSHDTSGNAREGKSVPVAVQLPQVLANACRVCDRSLMLSQFPHATRCFRCGLEIEPNAIAYWCPEGHVAVCTKCTVCSQQARQTPDDVMGQLNISIGGLRNGNDNLSNRLLAKTGGIACKTLPSDGGLPQTANGAANW